MENHLSQPDSGSRSVSRKLLKILCWTQCVLAIVSAIAVFFHVEAIVVFCPLMAILGLLVAYLSLPIASLNLLLFSLFCPLATCVIAYLISAFDWSPREAEAPVKLMLIVNAAITFFWVNVVSGKINSTVFNSQSVKKPIIRYSIGNLLALLTFASIFFTVVKFLVLTGDMLMFATYGTVVLMLSLAIYLKFHWRSKQLSQETI